MQRDPFLLTVSLLVAAGCAEDGETRTAPPPPAPEGPTLDASFDDGDDEAWDARARSSVPGPGGPPLTADALPDAGAGCHPRVSDSLIEHACFHARGGPYRDVGAGADAIDVSRAHTAFRIALAPAPSGGYAATLTYQARTTFAYALFASPGAQLTRVDPSAPPPLSAHPTELCPELPRVAAHMLRAGVHDLLVSSELPSATVVIETVSEGGIGDASPFACDAPSAAAAGSSLDAGTDASVEAPPLSSPAAPQTASQRDARDPPSLDEAGPNEPTPSPPGASQAEVATAPEGVPAAAPPELASDAPECRVDPVLEHACLHVQHGPFAEVDATRGTAAVPAISAPHTVYVLRLGADAGRVAYRPVLEGQHVFYLEADLPLTLHTPDGPLLPTHRESVTDCAGLARAHVFTLTAGTRYEVEIGPGRATTRVLVESVDSLTFDGWDARFEPCT